MRIGWTPTAAADLQNIYDYLKEHEPHLARPTVIEIRKSARSLEKFPLRGRKGREEGTRELLQRRLPHIIAYRVAADAVEILHIGIRRKTGKQNAPVGSDHIRVKICSKGGHLMARICNGTAIPLIPRSGIAPYRRTTYLNSL
jgi:toxin ParE1/3/4